MFAYLFDNFLYWIYDDLQKTFPTYIKTVYFHIFTCCPLSLLPWLSTHSATSFSFSYSDSPHTYSLLLASFIWLSHFHLPPEMLILIHLLYMLNNSLMLSSKLPEYMLLIICRPFTLAIIYTLPNSLHIHPFVSLTLTTQLSLHSLSPPRTSLPNSPFSCASLTLTPQLTIKSLAPLVLSHHF